MFHMEKRPRYTLIIIIIITWPMYRNVSDEESSLGIDLNGMYISSVSWE